MLAEVGFLQNSWDITKCSQIQLAKFAVFLHPFTLHSCKGPKHISTGWFPSRFDLLQGHCQSYIIFDTVIRFLEEVDQSCEDLCEVLSNLT